MRIACRCRRSPEPEEELAKAQLASRIREIVRSSRLTQAAAAGVMGIDQPKVSALLNGVGAGGFW
ncbi:MAG TPA: XRE family transcriptional regulator [Vicinamibacterales bacterium]|nr:XRE family transcriptional regulator [Vicinamibacterales bacterium]